LRVHGSRIKSGMTNEVVSVRLFPLEISDKLVAERALAFAEAGGFEDGDADEADRLDEGALDRQAGAEAAGERAGEGAAGAVRVLGVEALGLDVAQGAARRDQPVDDPPAFGMAAFRHQVTAVAQHRFLAAERLELRN